MARCATSTSLKAILSPMKIFWGRPPWRLLGPATADKLFGRKAGLVGETVRIEGRPFRVIGVLEAKGGSAFGNQDDQVLVPLTTATDALDFPQPTRPGGYAHCSGKRCRCSSPGESGDLPNPADSTPHGNWCRRFHRPDPGRFPEYGTDDYRCADHFPGRHCRHLAAGRRNWHYEHHAGLRDRTHPRDWFAQGIGRTPGGYLDPVPRPNHRCSA